MVFNFALAGIKILKFDDVRIWYKLFTYHTMCLHCNKTG